jgi:hypothetical protein
MRPSETLIEFFDRFEDALRNYVLLHGRDKVTTGLGTKFIYRPRAFVEDNCCFEDKNNAILSHFLKESYLKNAVCDIPEYKFALMTDAYNVYKVLRELLIKTDLNAGRNQKLKGSQYSSYQLNGSQKLIHLSELLGKDLERKLRDDFKGHARARGNTASDSYYSSGGGYGTLGKSLKDDNRMNEEDPRDQYCPSSLDDDESSRSEYYSHCATTVPLTDDSAKFPNTLDAFSLADTIPETANKDSENNIKGPDLDSEHVHDSDAIHELLMDIDIDSDEDQVDTWSDGISGVIPKTTTVTPEARRSQRKLAFLS